MGNPGKNILGPPSSVISPYKILESTVVHETTQIGSRLSDHYFRSVCWFVCLCRVFLSRLWSDFDQTRTCYMSGCRI